MELSGLSIALGVVAMSSLASLIVLWILGLIRTPVSQQQETPFAAPELSNTFLLKGDQIIDHDVTSMPTYLRDMDGIRDWADLRDWLGMRFDNLPKNLTAISKPEQTFADRFTEDPGVNLTLKSDNETTRVCLTTAEPISLAAWHDASHQAYLSYATKDTLDHVSFPIWKTDAKGKMIWRNAAMAEIVKDLGQMPTIIPASKDSATKPRFSIQQADAASPTWYEVETRKISAEETLHVATGIDQVVRAETAQRDFVQTLTKTFANLTTGLAVFDKNRQLALFNPALVDLTGISVSFLSARPDVIRFFDELRERQVLPEPKNYANLRTHIREVIAKANEGNYLEIWNLPGGMTYRVTGRPHPDGAVAFLIEDISAEVLKTRQFRTQIDLGQSVIDGLDEAIVVIAPNDLLLLCNTACSDLLKIDPGSSFADMSVTDLLRACCDQFTNDALWSIFEIGVRNGTSHNECEDRFLNLRNGKRLQYRLKLLPGGARMIGFSKLPSAALTHKMTAAE